MFRIPIRTGSTVNFSPEFGSVIVCADPNPSIYKQRKHLISAVFLWLLNKQLILKNNVNVPKVPVSNVKKAQKTRSDLASGEKNKGRIRTRIWRRIRFRWCGYADPDPCQNVTVRIRDTGRFLLNVYHDPVQLRTYQSKNTVHTGNGKPTAKKLF